MASIFPNRDIQLVIFSWLDPEGLTTAEQVCREWRNFVAWADPRLWARHLLALAPKPSEPNQNGHKWQPFSEDDGFSAYQLKAGEACPRFLNAPAIRRLQPFSNYYVQASPHPIPASQKNYKTAFALQLFLVRQSIRHHRRTQLLFDLYHTEVKEALDLVGETFWWAKIDGEIKSALVRFLAGFHTPQVIALFKRVHDNVDTRYFQNQFLESAINLGLHEYYPEFLPIFYPSSREFNRKKIESALTSVGGLGAALDFVDPKSSGQASSATRLANLYKDGKTEPWTKAWAIDHLFPLDSPTSLLLYFESPPDLRVEIAMKKHFETVDPAVLVPIIKQVALDTDKSNQCRWTAAAKLLARDRAALTPDQLSQLPDHKFPLPQTIPEDLRAALVHWWADSAEPGTDPRWLIEAALIGAGPHDHDATHNADWATLTSVATKALGGIPVAGPIESWDLHGTGGGNYQAIKIACFPDREDTAELKYYKQVLMLVSEVGPYCSIRTNTGYRSKNGASGGFSIASQKELAAMKGPEAKLATEAAAKEALVKAAEAVVLAVVPENTLRTVFGGLNIYYFGERKPLTVSELLFYWQD